MITFWGWSGLRILSGCSIHITIHYGPDYAYCPDAVSTLRSIMVRITHTVRMQYPHYDPLWSGLRILSGCSIHITIHYGPDYAYCPDAVSTLRSIMVRITHTVRMQYPNYDPFTALFKIFSVSRSKSLLNH